MWRVNRPMVWGAPMCDSLSGVPHVWAFAVHESLATTAPRFAPAACLMVVDRPPPTYDRPPASTTVLLTSHSPSILSSEPTGSDAMADCNSRSSCFATPVHMIVGWLKSSARSGVLGRAAVCVSGSASSSGSSSTCSRGVNDRARRYAAMGDNTWTHSAVQHPGRGLAADDRRASAREGPAAHAVAR